MNLREIKKEVESLSNIQQTLKKFQEHWLKPLKNNSHEFSPEIKQELNQKLKEVRQHSQEINSGQMLQDKLRQYARYLIDLKLTALRGDKRKSQYITNSFLNDEFFNIKQTINEVASFSEVVKELAKSYDHVNGLLTQNLPLEDSLSFFDLPHNLHLKRLQKTAQKQKELMQTLGKCFVNLVRENK